MGGGLLDGRCVVVTGAGRGLGRAYALACAAHGAAVVVNDVDGTAAHAVAAEITAAGGHAVAEPGSAGSWEVAARLAGTAELEFGRLDGLVANAGIIHHGPPWEEDEACLRRITEVNVLGVQFAAVHAMRAMVRRGGGGSIVTVVSGARFGIPGMSAYGATKGAVAAMTAGWARDCASAGIRVNAVSPLAETGMAALDTRPDRPALGTPEDVAPVVVALLSDATRGVTGRIVRFDGAELGVYAPEVLAPVTGWAAGDPAASIAEALARLGGAAAAGPD
ncbi:SDR family NAD(P)-dependent oxidoreductase [Nonomuraea wenchangensis]|uniref:SDR family NAD(P)-dependent oxidoreductase n=1 Tax=Nonomuraea wenchangensis TaxID=568860 RepID=UPI003330809F